jgi:hypothetical protein
MEETPLHLIGCPSLPSLVVVASLWLWSMVHKKKIQELFCLFAMFEGSSEQLINKVTEETHSPCIVLGWMV